MGGSDSVFDQPLVTHVCFISPKDENRNPKDSHWVLALWPHLITQSVQFSPSYIDDSVLFFDKFLLFLFSLLSLQTPVSQLLKFLNWSCSSVILFLSLCLCTHPHTCTPEIALTLISTPYGGIFKFGTCVLKF